MRSIGEVPATAVTAEVASLAAALNRDLAVVAPRLLAAVPQLSAPPSAPGSGPLPLETPEEIGGLLDGLGPQYETALAAETRQSGGVFFTPRAVADGVTAMAVEALGVKSRQVPTTGHGPTSAMQVLDPSCGSGAFLLAAARAQRRNGVAVSDILAGLRGVDIDPVAVALCEATLRLWAAAADPAADVGVGPHLAVGDYLDPPAGGWTGAMGGLGSGSDARLDLVVGNPPFLSQLHQPTARAPEVVARLQGRFGDAAKGYGDTAGMFLLAACDDLRPNGVVALVQPVSLLAADGARALRKALVQRAAVRAIWDGTGRVFDANVDVCAPVLQLRAEPASGVQHGEVVRRVGMDFVPAAPGDALVGTDSWAAWLSSGHAVPEVVLVARSAPSTRDDPALGGGSLGDLCSATAGFRDQFYGLAPHVVDTAQPTDEMAPLVTSGLIDPLHNRWGGHQARFAKRRFDHPVVDLASLEADPKLLAWVRGRLVPKVMCATQTRVLEVVTDPNGAAVPSTPVVSVEVRPEMIERHGAELATNLVAAALCAPPLSALLARNLAGTGLSGDTIRLSARHVEALPLPCHDEPWLEAAALVAPASTGAPADLVGIGELMCVAYGLEPNHAALHWWAGRLPGRR
jgi:hypothetical protein